mgnify:CR=1 FL=1
MKLPKLLSLFTLIFLLLLIVVLFIEAIPTRVEGVLTYTTVSGKSISSITIRLPLSESGENIFKISQMKARTSSGFEWTVIPGSCGYDKYPDYWVLSGPPLHPNDELIISFTMEGVRDINYKLYPWKVISDVETEITVAVPKNFLVYTVTYVERYRYFLMLALGSLVAIMGVSSFVTWRRTLVARPRPAPTRPTIALPLAEQIKLTKRKLEDEVLSVSDDLRGVNSLKERVERYEELVNKLDRKYTNLRGSLPREWERKIENMLKRGRDDLSMLKREIKNLEEEARRIQERLSEITTRIKIIDEIEDRARITKKSREFKRIESQFKKLSDELNSQLASLKGKASQIREKVWSLYPVYSDVEEMISNLSELERER